MTNINYTTTSYGSYTLNTLLTVYGWFTNAQALTWNTNYLLTGDPPAIEAAKINAGFSNVWTWSIAQSNLLSCISGNFVVLSNNVILGSNSFVNLSNAWSAFVATNVPGGTAATMSFDGGTITSDGSGNATFVSIFAQQLKDSGGSTGSSGNYAQANGSGGWYWTAWPATLNFDSSDITSDGSGNITASSFKGNLIDDTSSSGLATFVPTANGDGSWTWQPGGGSSDSATLPTNVVYGVYSYLAFGTNFAYWRAGSNFLATVPGLYSWSITGGDDGGNPPFQLPVSLMGSFNGTSGFFPITNGFFTSNTISVWLMATNSASDPNITNYVGGAIVANGEQVNPGFARLFSLNDWSHTGQLGEAVNLAAGATTNYVNSAVANVAAVYPSHTDTNGVYHTTFTVAGQSIFDVAQTTTWVPITWTGIDATGTNFLLSVVATNLNGGFSLQSNTNLTLIYNWQNWTNFSTNIVSATNTFTIPMNMSLPCQFFRVIQSQSSGFTILPMLTVNQGILYPSNAWNLNTITSTMPNRSFWVGNSNGVAMVSVFLSNGVVRIKQTAP